MSAVNGVLSVDLAVTDLARSRAFYSDVWNLEEVEATPDAAYFRGTGTAHHILGLHAADEARMLRVTLGAADRDAVDEIWARTRDADPPEIAAPAPVTELGGGYAFTFKDPEQRVVRVLSGDERHADDTVATDRPTKITHVVLNSCDREGMADFYCGTLGVRVIDRTKIMTFLNTGPYHHSLVFAESDVTTVNHVAYEMPDIDSVMRGAGRMRDHGFDIQWGVGRHGPGNNVFSYFLGPDGEVIEYTADVQRIDETYRVGTPADWGWPEGRTDHWGIAIGPTDQLKSAQRSLSFGPHLFGL